MDKQKNKRRGEIARRKGNRAAMIAITFVVCLLFIVLLAKGVQLKQRIRANDETREQLEEQIKEEKARTGEIEDLKEYMQTNEYIRQVAKNVLGLVEDGDSSSRNTRVFRHEIRAQSETRLHREYNLAMKNKSVEKPHASASGG